MSEALKKLKARVKYLEQQQANRWAAFTDDELGELVGGLDAWIDDPLHVNPEWESTRALAAEITAELERRKP